MSTRFGTVGHLGPLLRQPFPGGRIVEWTVAEPERVRAAAQPRGSVTFLQTEHLVNAVAGRVRGEPHRAIIGGLVRFDGALDVAAMTHAISEFTRRHDEMRAHYAVGEAGISRMVAPPAAVEFVAQEPPEGPVVVDSDGIGDYAAQRIVTVTDFDSIPAIHVGAATDDSGFTLYLGTDHVHGDGYSLWLAVGEIVEDYRARVAGRPATHTAAGDYADFVAAEAAAAGAVSGDADGVAIWRDALAATGGPPSPPIDLGVDDGVAVPAVRSRRDLLTAAQAAAVDDRVRDLGASFTGALYAALAAAQYALTGDRLFCTATAVATRSPEHERTQGWLCNFAPICFDVDPDVNLATLAVTATEAVRRARIAAAIPVGAVLAQLAQAGELPPMAGSPQMVTYLDHRRFPGVTEPTVATTVGFPGVGRTKNVNLWLSRLVDVLTVETQIPDNEIARRNVAAYFDHVAAALAAFAAGEDQPLHAAGDRRISV